MGKQKIFFEVVGALLEHNGKLLICQRMADDQFGSLWEFPGGKVKPGEEKMDALKRELKEFVSDVLFDARTKKRGYFNYELITKLIKDYQNGSKDYSRHIWSLLCFELWHRAYVD